MQLVFSDHAIPTSIVRSLFLAGPSPRVKSVHDWRHDALAYLKSIGWEGTVFIPVPEKRFYGFDDTPDWTYDNQVKWECLARKVSDIILFWIPRDIKGGMPAFTTNIEFGEDIHTGKIVYGRPDNAEKCRYLDKRIEEIGLPVFNQLDVTLDYAIHELGEGAYRELGEVNVPLFIWKTAQFQSWYADLKTAGNRLDDAAVLQFTKIGQNFIFSFMLWVKVWIEKEQRHKINESFFSRKDISVIVPYYKEQDNIQIVLVKEFRSSVSNSHGYVYELPGGSSFKPGVDPLTNAQHELEEETGLYIEDATRFSYVGQAQLCATVSSHKAHVYKIALNKNEFEQIQQDAKTQKTFGVSNDTEKTYVLTMNIKELHSSYVDFSMLGMIFKAIYE